MSDLSSSVGSGLPASARLDSTSKVRSVNGDDSVARAEAAAAGGVIRGADQVDVSAESVALQKLRELPELRTDLIESIKAQIRADAYDTPERLDAALDGLIDEEILGQ
ncbi:MAG: flagellar biosynthesis anti-sigma factor FlgM [Planctomycetota bacterium]